jgi:hypothetical protein
MREMISSRDYLLRVKITRTSQDVEDDDGEYMECHTAITCWRCYETGHYAPDCPLNDEKFSSNSATGLTYDAYPPRVTSSRNVTYPQNYPSRPKNE